LADQEAWTADWCGPPHPCSQLPERDARLARRVVAAPAATLAALRPLSRDPHVVLIAADAPRFEAELTSPSADSFLCTFEARRGGRWAYRVLD